MLPLNEPTGKGEAAPTAIRVDASCVPTAYRARSRRELVSLKADRRRDAAMESSDTGPRHRQHQPWIGLERRSGRWWLWPCRSQRQLIGWGWRALACLATDV